MTDEQLNEKPESESETMIDPDQPQTTDATPSAADRAIVAGDEDPHAEPPQYGVGPFSVREVSLIGVWLVAFVVSFFSLSTVRFDSVWTSGLLWVLTIGVPTAAMFLIVLRRLSPEGIRRVGSLGIDQFASVAFSVATVVWLQVIWETVAVVISDGPWLRSWVMWVSFVLMLVGVLLTVFAPFIAPFHEDFRGRPEIPAHRNARPIRPISPRPAPQPRPAPEPQAQPQPILQDEFAATTGYGAYEASPAVGAQPEQAPAENDAWAPAHARDTFEPVEQPAEQAPVETVRYQAFWALVPEERDVVDDSGVPIFRIGPTAWALVIEDRVSTFVVRHEDGRVGYLHNVEGVTRG